MTNKVPRKFTDEETEYCIHQFLKGKKVSEIAKDLDRTTASIKSKLNREKNLNPKIFETKEDTKEIEIKPKEMPESIQYKNIYRSLEEVESLVIDLINNEEIIEEVLSSHKFTNEEEMYGLLSQWKNEVI